MSLKKTLAAQAQLNADSLQVEAPTPAPERGTVVGHDPATNRVIVSVEGARRATASLTNGGIPLGAQRPLRGQNGIDGQQHRPSKIRQEPLPPVIRSEQSILPFILRNEDSFAPDIAGGAYFFYQDQTAEYQVHEQILANRFGQQLTSVTPVIDLTEAEEGEPQEEGTRNTAQTYDLQLNLIYLSSPITVSLHHTQPNGAPVFRLDAKPRCKPISFQANPGEDIIITTRLLSATLSDSDPFEYAFRRGGIFDSITENFVENNRFLSVAQREDRLDFYQAQGNYFRSRTDQVVQIADFQYLVEITTSFGTYSETYTNPGYFIVSPSQDAADILDQRIASNQDRFDGQLGNIFRYYPDYRQYGLSRPPAAKTYTTSNNLTDIFYTEKTIGAHYIGYDFLQGGNNAARFFPLSIPAHDEWADSYDGCLPTSVPRGSGVQGQIGNTFIAMFAQVDKKHIQHRYNAEKGAWEWLKRRIYTAEDVPSFGTLEDLVGDTKAFMQFGTTVDNPCYQTTVFQPRVHVAGATKYATATPSVLPNGRLSFGITKTSVNLNLDASMCLDGSSRSLTHTHPFLDAQIPEGYSLFAAGANEVPAKRAK